MNPYNWSVADGIGYKLVIHKFLMERQSLICCTGWSESQLGKEIEIAENRKGMSSLTFLPKAVCHRYFGGAIFADNIKKPP